MELFVKNLGKRTMKVFKVYTKEEADEAGIEYKYWRELDKGDKYGMTDDGYVSEVVTLSFLVDKYIPWAGNVERKVKRDTLKVVFPFGMYFSRLTKGGKWNNKVCSFSDACEREGNYRVVRRGEYISYAILDRNFKTVIKEYAKRRVCGVSHKDAVKQVLMYFKESVLHTPGKSNQYAKRRIELLYGKRKEAQEYIVKEISEILEQYDIDDKYLIEKWKKALEIAENSKNADSMLKAIKMVGEWKGYGAKKTAVTEQIGMVSREYLEGKVVAEEQLLANRHSIGSNNESS